MERKAVEATGRRKPARGATAWAVAALAAWAALLVAAAAFSGLLGELTRHDLLIGAVGVSFVLMALASVSLLRHDLRTYFLPIRHQNRRPRP